MAFLSGIKVAYDSLGSEITRTFDSSKEHPLDQNVGTATGDHAAPGDFNEVSQCPLKFNSPFV